MKEHYTDQYGVGQGREVPGTQTQVEAYEAQIARQKALITELCDALDAYTPDVEGGYAQAKQLIQRAREAVK